MINQEQQLEIIKALIRIVLQLVIAYSRSGELGKFLQRDVTFLQKFLEREG